MAAATPRGEHDAGVRAVESRHQALSALRSHAGSLSAARIGVLSPLHGRRRLALLGVFAVLGRRPLASEIVIRRTPEQGDFTSREMALLHRLHPHLADNVAALVRCAATCQSAGADVSPDEACEARCIRALPGEFTGAERELVHFVRIGFSNKEIAARLDKSVRTVKTQLTSVYKKCGVRSRSRLLAMMMPRLSYD